MSDHPVISFSIVSWNVREYLWKCLQSIERFVDTPHEIVVVDNASSDDTVRVIRENFPHVRCIANAVNVGFARANNQALDVVRGDYVVVLNPDTEFIDNPFPVLLHYLHEHDECACVGPEILNTDHTHQQSVRNFPRVSDQSIVLLKMRHFFSSTATMRRYLADPGAGRREATSVDQIMGACMVIPREKLQVIGQFDAGYPNWFEEVDWCQRAHQARLTVVYNPAAHVIHHGGQSFAQVYSFKKQRWFNQGLRRYAKKNWSAMSQIAIACLVPVNLLLSGLQTLVIRY